ncbi:MAG: J domain-containing protein [Pseudomonadota bacterium]
MIKLLLLIAVVVAFFYFGKQMLSSGAGMSRNEAARLLEVDPDANAETILAAHRRLIGKVHPDAGGSAELAARVNQARDTLLRNLPR